MDIRLIQDGHRVHVLLSGDLDYGAHDAFEAEVRRLVERSSHLDLDFRQVRFLDSSGVAALLACCEDAEKAGVKIRLLNVAEEIVEIFAVLGVKDVLPLN